MGHIIRATRGGVRAAQAELRLWTLSQKSSTGSYYSYLHDEKDADPLAEKAYRWQVSRWKDDAQYRMSLGNSKLKQQNTTACLLKQLKFKTRQHWQGCRAMGIFTHCWQECKMVQFGKRFGSSLQTKYTLTIRYSNHTLWHLPKRTENIGPHKNLHMNVYSSFIHNCQNLEATKTSFNR